MIFEGSNPRYPVRDEALVGALLLGLALLPLPIGYYQFLRWAICLLAVSIITSAGRRRWLIGFALAMAALFNPILPVHFSRSIWMVIDVGVALALLWMGFTVVKREEPEQAEEMIEGSLDGDPASPQQ